MDNRIFTVAIVVIAAILIGGLYAQNMVALWHGCEPGKVMVRTLPYGLACVTP
jgi:hypothetical protein